MKKIILLFFLLSLGIGRTFGQPYKSLFGATQTSWNVAYFVMSDWTLTDSLIVCNDTIINSYTYKYVKDIGSMNFDGFLREDTMTGEVWYKDKSYNQEEFLIMDLSLNVGDTFIMHKSQFPEDSIAVVDSIKYNGGSKIIFLSPKIVLWNENLTFIEGIGPNAGIIFQLYQTVNFYPEGSRLLCSYKDDIQAYTNTGPPFYGKCHVLLGSIEENQSENSELRVFPNPSIDKVQIEYDGYKPYSLEVFDYTGKYIESRENIFSLRYELDMTDYIGGLYFIKTIGNDGKYAARSILKL
jgi:hypothetical protein